MRGEVRECIHLDMMPRQQPCLGHVAPLSEHPRMHDRHSLQYDKLMDGAQISGFDNHSGCDCALHLPESGAIVLGFEGEGLEGLWVELATDVAEQRQGWQCSEGDDQG